MATYSAYSDVVSGTTYLAAAAALFARFSGTPTLATKILYNKLIDDLITAGVWAKRDAYWILCGYNATDSLLNIKTGTFGTATLHGTTSPSFTVGQYYATDGSDNYINLHFNPTTNGTQFTKDSNSGGACILTSSSDADWGMGGRDSVPTNTYWTIRFRTGANLLAGYNHSTTLSGNKTIAAGNDVVFERVDSTHQGFVINGSPQATDVANSTALPNHDYFLGTHSLNGNPSGYVAHQWAYARMGNQLSAAEHAAEYAALEYFRTHIVATL